jgi:hypothetical protein
MQKAKKTGAPLSEGETFISPFFKGTPVENDRGIFAATQKSPFTASPPRRHDNEKK